VTHLAEGVLEERRRHRAEHRVERFEPPDRRLHELAAPDPAGAEGVGLGGGVECREIGQFVS
jgi:hypothetical protein